MLYNLFALSIDSYYNNYIIYNILFYIQYFKFVSTFLFYVVQIVL